MLARLTVIALGIGVLSYAGQLNATVVADPDAVPDLPVFLTGLRRALTGPDL